MDETHRPSLYPVSPDAYGTLYKQHLLELYMHYVESAERISERRTLTNRFLLAVNASLVTLYAVGSSLRASRAWHLLVPLAGIIVCTAWLSLVENYRNLNSVKFQVIHEIEKVLPVSLYAYEWNLLDQGSGKVYRPVTHIEQWIPVVFILLYVGLMFYFFLSQ